MPLRRTESLDNIPDERFAQMRVRMQQVNFAAQHDRSYFFRRDPAAFAELGEGFETRGGNFEA